MLQRVDGGVRVREGDVGGPGLSARESLQRGERVPEECRTTLTWMYASECEDPMIYQGSESERAHGATGKASRESAQSSRESRQSSRVKLQGQTHGFIDVLSCVERAGGRERVRDIFGWGLLRVRYLRG